MPERRRSLALVDPDGDPRRTEVTMQRPLSLAALAAVATLAVTSLAAAQAPPRLTGKVGPGFTISLKTASGARVARLKAGTYTIVVTDRTGDDAHNFHFRGAGVDMKTTVGFVGTKTWRVRFQRDKTYRFLCDPHELAMRGSFRTF